MKGFHSRLRGLREHLNLSVDGMAKELGLHRSYIYKLESGEVAEPSQKIIRALVSRFSVNQLWLETGEGQMGAPMSTPTAEAALANISHLERALRQLSVPELRDVLAFLLKWEEKSELAPIRSICAETAFLVSFELTKRVRLGWREPKERPPDKGKP